MSPMWCYFTDAQSDGDKESGPHDTEAGFVSETTQLSSDTAGPGVTASREFYGPDDLEVEGEAVQPFQVRAQNALFAKALLPVWVRVRRTTPTSWGCEELKKLRGLPSKSNRYLSFNSYNYPDQRHK